MTPSSRPQVTLFHSPHTRSSGALVLLEELDADYSLHLLDMKGGEQRRAEYLAINPMGKVPAIRHGDTLVTEQAAVYMYLAELYAQRGLAPSPGDPQRGAYLRWMVFYGSCFEPAVVDRAMKREPAPPSTSPYGDFDNVLATLEQQLASAPYLLGERFSAADVLWGNALAWTVGFKLVPERPVFMACIERFSARPAVQRARAKDAELAAQLARA
jgi:glutathione S-transferase